MTEIAEEEDTTKEIEPLTEILEDEEEGDLMVETIEDPMVQAVVVEILVVEALVEEAEVVVVIPLCLTRDLVSLS